MIELIYDSQEIKARLKEAEELKRAARNVVMAFRGDDPNDQGRALEILNGVYARCRAVEEKSLVVPIHGGELLVEAALAVEDALEAVRRLDGHVFGQVAMNLQTASAQLDNAVDNWPVPFTIFQIFKLCRRLAWGVSASTGELYLKGIFGRLMAYVRQGAEGWEAECWEKGVRVEALTDPTREGAIARAEDWVMDYLRKER